MKRALTLLSLILIAACASNDGFMQNNVNNCGPGAEVGIEAGWDNSASGMENGPIRRTMLVQVSNNSDHEITVKRIYIDPLTMNADSRWELERGAADPNKVVAEGDASTFEIPMTVKRRLDPTSSMQTTSGVELTVTVLLEPEQTYRCRFGVPMAF
ncbi:MAG: hypothetical protein ACJ74H_07810 [Thermoanaerobaculia bacterium]